jgi:hypothetical protein
MLIVDVTPIVPVETTAAARTDTRDVDVRIRITKTSVAADRAAIICMTALHRGHSRFRMPFDVMKY